MKSIEIIMNVNGDAVVQTKGFTGPSCREASAFIERVLGEKAAEQLTAEFYQSQTIIEHAQQQS